MSGVKDEKSGRGRKINPSAYLDKLLISGRGGVPRAMSEVKSGSKKMAKSPGHGKMAKSPTYKSPGSKVKGMFKS